MKQLPVTAKYFKEIIVKNDAPKEERENHPIDENSRMEWWFQRII